MPEDRLNDYLDSLTSFSPGLPYTHIAARDSKPEDDEPTDEELAAYAQQDEEEERLRQLILDAGLDGCYGIEGAAYALAW